MKKRYVLTTLLVSAAVRAQGPDAAAATVTVDGTHGPVAMRAEAAGVPKARRAPEVAAVAVQLPDTREMAPLVGPVDASSFQPAGYVEDAPPGLVAAVSWTPAPGGFVFATELTSNNAQALRVRLAGPFSHGLELRVYDPATGSSFGPYTFDHLGNQGEYWTTIIFGARIGLEFFASSADAPRPPPLPKIDGIAYIADLPGGVAAAQGCAHRDVSCEAAWADEADAVTMLSVINANSNVVGFCSGALLNRTPSDLSPLVATANHCLGGQTSANNTTYVWRYETASCNGAAPTQNQLNNLPRSTGSYMLKRHVDSDYNLVGLYQPPGGNFYLGWSNGSWSDGSSATGIHHPGGTFKRISFGSKTGSQNQRFCDTNNNCFDADVWNISYTTGFTQPGSSGSPIMDGSARVRGTLSGGPSSDCTISRYGRFDEAFPNLRYYLFEPASPMYVNGSYSGDPGNNGSSERGFLTTPFNTVQEATYAVRANDTILITPGSYNERFTIRRPMVLERFGDSGSVIIGE